LRLSFYLCCAPASPRWAELFVDCGVGDSVFPYFSDTSPFLVDALVSFFHQLLFLVPPFRVHFVAGGQLASYLRLFRECNDPSLVEHLWFILMYIASPQCSFAPLSDDDVRPVLIDVLHSFAVLSELALFDQFCAGVRSFLDHTDPRLQDEILLNTTYFSDVIELLRRVDDESITVETTQAVLITIASIIKCAAGGFSITAVPYELIYPLLFRDISAIARRAWFVLTESIRREPAWIVPELVGSGLYVELREKIADMAFEVKSAALELLMRSLERASAAEWANLVGELGLLDLTLENLDGTDIWNLAPCNDMIARVLKVGGWQELIVDHRDVLVNLVDTADREQLKVVHIEAAMRGLDEWAADQE
jgi:hypothetical protein